jgi:hypothetical protein
MENEFKQCMPTTKEIYDEISLHAIKALDKFKFEPLDEVTKKAIKQDIMQHINNPKMVDDFVDSLFNKLLGEG